MFASFRFVIFDTIFLESFSQILLLAKQNLALRRVNKLIKYILYQDTITGVE